MGTVQGVHMKYTALSTISYGLLFCLAPTGESAAETVEGLHLWLLSSLAYVSAINGLIAILFRMEEGMAIIGKDEVTGEVPAWSYALFAGFHFPTWLYTKIQRISDKAKGIAVADEVAPGWWIGGRYGHELGRTWAGIIDLTCEFPESCKGRSLDSYLLLRCWDGVPPTADQLEQAATFAVRQKSHGDVLVHCAHGRGRSTTVMCACLVKAGLFKTWEEAFHAVKARRTVVKLNRRMRAALSCWQETHGARMGS